MTIRRALVLVHGFLGASNNWLAVVAKLKTRREFRDWDIFCPDLRWHGGDPRRFENLNHEENPPSTLSVAKALAVECQRLDASELILVGHSFGLRPLLKIISQNMLPSKKILGLVAEDSAPVLSAHGTAVLEKILAQTPVPFVSREQARRFFDDEYGPSSAMSRFLLSNIREDSAKGGQVWRFPQTHLLSLLRHSAAESLQKEWEQIRVPVAMIVGAKSQHLSEASAREWQQRRLSRGLPAELNFVADAGHWVHAERTEAFVDALTEAVVKMVRLSSGGDLS